MKAFPLLLLLLGLSAARLPAQVDRVVSTGAAPRVVGPTEGERRVLRDGRHILLKVGPANTGAGYLFLGAEDLPPGTLIPRHRHELDEEILIVHRGELTVELDDSTHVAPAGSVVYLPPRSWVAVANRGTATATIMFVFPRGSVERCFQFVGTAPGEAPRQRTPQEEAEERRACQMTYQSHAH
ncbi:MAG TPA: cupin domain-containing protein [Longimicrobiaceae bacterium]|nr:cupin domain-containing protein [Longimicrobiaceae bacterium]